jgi:hypothetical protein
MWKRKVARRLFCQLAAGKMAYSRAEVACALNELLTANEKFGDDSILAVTLG